VSTNVGVIVGVSVADCDTVGVIVVDFVCNEVRVCVSDGD
jgi:very-short-patch-repair endonuclease